VTTPFDPATLARLRAVAAWDGAAVTGARATFADVLDRLTNWRARLDGLGRALGDARCWSGPAADVAAATVLDVSRAAAGVEAAFARSQEGWDALAASAGPARDLAERALVLAALDEAGATGWMLPPAAAVAADALAAAAAAGAAARAAVAGVDGVAGLVPGQPPPGLPDLLARLGPLQVPGIPGGAAPVDVAAWWAGLSAAEHEALVAHAPEAVGSLDGVPAWARDRANRLLLARLLETPDLPDGVARAAQLLQERINAEEAAGGIVQLHLLDLAHDRVVLSLGDLDTADAIALLVPGILTTPDDDLGAMVGDARAVAEASTAAASGVGVAAVVWLGYRTPQTIQAMSGRTSSVVGGRALAAALDGLAAVRTAVGSPPARTTVLAHSYGSVVVDEAADLPGRLAAHAVVLLGSPGMAEDAASLEVPEVYDAGSVTDLIARSGWFGMPAGSPAYGSAGLPTDRWAGHSGYYDDGPTLDAVGEVVAGAREPE
jgi:hypothetical protein